MKTYTTRPVSWVVAPEGDPVFSEDATTIAIKDEAGGEFITISQVEGEIRINPEEWQTISMAVERAISEIERASKAKESK